MIEHVAVSADDPQKMVTVGTVSNVRWKAPYLVADLCVWDGEAIRAIQNEAQRELSCGYRYKAVMKPGTIGGEKFDGRMVHLHGNHVALVATGRVGSDVIVRDEALLSDAYRISELEQAKPLSKDFLAMHRNVLRRFDADANLYAFSSFHGDDNIGAYS
jgi:hypothetical protein